MRWKTWWGSWVCSAWRRKAGQYCLHLCNGELYKGWRQILLRQAQQKVNRQQLQNAAKEIPNRYKETPHHEGGWVLEQNGDLTASPSNLGELKNLTRQGPKHPDVTLKKQKIEALYLQRSLPIYNFLWLCMLLQLIFSLLYGQPM